MLYFEHQKLNMKVKVCNCLEGTSVKPNPLFRMVNFPLLPSTSYLPGGALFLRPSSPPPTNPPPAPLQCSLAPLPSSQAPLPSSPLPLPSYSVPPPKKKKKAEEGDLLSSISCP